MGRAARACLFIGAAVLLAGLGVFLIRAGLDRADKLASVLGLFLNIAAIVLTVLGLRGGAATGPPAGGVTIHGDVTARRDFVVGDVTYQQRPGDDDAS
ncbi:hypothetical protein [Actinoplanes sp. L3-i22]|uniref:hypothetical protein n=1 Tax=Actinoplanes sp. L3-i22 TaxID=2836373 RepID=UPI001C75B69D|nr:hypothetical protein [Actinoplanes sp. L3-i22]BCY10698.1 hypothetical protein L3i22_057860 [Actinoplanes sp. L3-i22]